MKFFIVFALAIAAAHANSFLTCTTTEGGLGGALYTDMNDDIVAVRFRDGFDRGFIVCADCHGNRSLKKIEFDDYAATISGYVAGVNGADPEVCNPVDCIFDNSEAQQQQFDIQCEDCSCDCTPGDCNCDCGRPQVCECEAEACDVESCTNECRECNCRDAPECALTTCESECPECPACPTPSCGDQRCERICPPCPQCEGPSPPTCEECDICEQEQSCSCNPVEAPVAQICSMEPVQCSNDDSMVALDSDALCVYNGASDPADSIVVYVDSNGNQQTHRMTVPAGELKCDKSIRTSGVCNCLTEKSKAEEYSFF